MSKTRRVLLYSFLLLSPLAFCKWTYDYTIFKLILPQIFFLLIALTFFLEKKNVKYHKTLTILLSLYLLVNIFSFFINPYRHLSYPYLIKLLAYFSIFLLAVNLREEAKQESKLPPLRFPQGRNDKEGGHCEAKAKQSQRNNGLPFLLYVLFLSGALLSFWAISDFYKFGLVNAGFGNKNFFAGYIIFLIPLSLSFAVHRNFLFSEPERFALVKHIDIRRCLPHNIHCGKGLRTLISTSGDVSHTARLLASLIYFLRGRIIFFCLFLLYSFALFLTKSQAAYLAVIIAILFLFVSYSKNRKMVLIKIFSILFFVFLISSFSNFYFIDQITGNVRFLVWRGTINMAKVNPFTGWGPGTFSLHYPNYRVTEYYLQKAVAPITAHSHCEYLEILAETGIFGLLLFIGFIFVIFKEGFVALRDSSAMPQNDKRRVIGLLAGILALLIDNLLSTNLRQSFTPVLLFFAMGLVVSYLKPIRDCHVANAPRNDRSFFIFLLPLLFLSLAAFNTFKRDVFAGFYLKKALNARLKKDFPRAILDYKKTISVDPFNLIAYYKLAFAYGTLKKYDLALSTYKKLYPLSPHYAQIDKNMGVLYYTKGNLDASLYYFRQAEKLNPYDVNTLRFIASIFLIRKEFQKARFYLKRILLLDSTNSYALACLKEIGRDDIINK